MAQISLHTTTRRKQKIRPLHFLLLLIGAILLLAATHHASLVAMDQENSNSLLSSLENSHVTNPAVASKKASSGAATKHQPTGSTYHHGTHKFKSGQNPLHKETLQASKQQRLLAPHHHHPLNLYLKNAVGTLAKDTAQAQRWEQQWAQQRQQFKEQRRQQQQSQNNDNLVVGLMVTNRPRYIDALWAQQETWLDAHIAPSRAFVVAGEPLTKASSGQKRLPRFVSSTCHDRELYCKRMMHIIEAHRMLTQDKIDFDWLLSGNEDWYVNVPELQTHLRPRHDVAQTEAVLYVFLGCGKPHVEKRIAGKNHSCEPMLHPPTGGICGGDGIVMSKKAVQVLMRDGAEALWARTRAQPFDFQNDHPQDDPVLSCVAYSYRGEIRLQLPPWEKRSLMKLPHHCPGKKCFLSTFHAIIQTNTTASGLIRRAHHDLLESEAMRLREKKEKQS